MLLSHNIYQVNIKTCKLPPVTYADISAMYAYGQLLNYLLNTDEALVHRTVEDAFRGRRCQMQGVSTRNAQRQPLYTDEFLVGYRLTS